MALGHSLDARQPFLPQAIELDGGPHVTQAIRGNLTMTSLLEQPVHVQSSDPMALGRLDAEGFAIEIKIETAGGAITSTHPLKKQMPPPIPVWLPGEPAAH